MSEHHFGFDADRLAARMTAPMELPLESLPAVALLIGCDVADIAAATVTAKGTLSVTMSAKADFVVCDFTLSGEP